MGVSNLNQFSFDLDAFSKKMEIKFETVLKRAALGIFTAIVRRTPVDTGAARASWVIGVNNFAAPANVKLAKGDKLEESAATRVSMARIAGFDIPNPFSLVIISNYLEYVQFLELGSSSKAPAGMVRISVEEEFARLRAAMR